MGNQVQGPRPPTGITIRQADVQDCLDIAPVLRDADREEAIARTGKTPVRALVDSLINSDEVYVAVEDGAPFILWGVGRGIVWLVGTDHILDRKVFFMRQAHFWFDHWSQKYGTLTNAVDHRNKLHIKWLTFLGCEWTEVTPARPDNPIPFIVFERRPCVY